ncbi:MAG: CBS domain-containing protein [Gemmatimonadales bacterium]|nr:CBS domain-containing protein [Gemmatimonadales bacterium]NIN12047.1 CBS domain-containing protein [Gemmatimonadales bacterium]NIR03282.1 CBS domain-containing protein [Gemmatimonadales bacterium]NIS66962.1 CBS domain-containing protein [Gemmatimonadales bacterium]
MATVQDILGRKGSDVVSMVAGESVLNAARLMNERGVGGVVVTDGGEVVGVFTERDILRRVVAEQLDPAATTLQEVMTSPVITCRPEAELEECVGLMTVKRVRHLPVVDDSGLRGVITSGDILAHQVQEQKDTIEYLNSYVFDIRR